MPRTGSEAPAQRQWWPGLEGLRGIGMVVVLLNHQYPWPKGGFLGVSMFFTMSGFLITNLLLREQGRTGGVAIRRFWGRRVRRLLPMAMVGLALASAVALATRSKAVIGPVAEDIRFAAINLANWRFIESDASYVAALTEPSTVTHYWSLAIEEQFYLLFPVVAMLALRRGRSGLAAVLGAATVLSVVAQLLSDGGDRAYFGTDTRLAEISIGCLAAVLWSGRLREVVTARHLDVVGGVAAVGMGVMWATVPLHSDVMWDGLMPVHASLAAVLMVAASHGSLLPQLTSWRPIVWLGGLSYPTYIVHVPIYLYLDADRVGVEGVPLFVLRAGTSILVAVVLRRLVEDPVRFRGAFTGRQAPVAAFSALGIVLVVASALPEVGSKPDALEEFVTGRTESPTLESAPVPEVDRLPTEVPARLGGDPTRRPSGEPPRALKVLVAGDSTAGTLGAGMQRWAADHGYAAVDRSGGPGCTLHQEGEAFLRPGWEYAPTPGCERLADLIVDDVGISRPDVLLLVIGSLNLADWIPTPGAEPVGFGDPGYDARYRADFDRALARFSRELDVPILVAVEPIPEWEPAGAPGTGPLTINSAVRTAHLNEVNAEVVARHPRARMVDLAGLVSDDDGVADRALHPDGLHLDEAVVPGLMDGGLAELLADAYRSVIDAEPALRRPGATIWWP